MAVPVPLRAVLTVLTFIMILFGWLLGWVIQTVARIITLPFIDANQRMDMCGHIFRRVSYYTAVAANPLWSVQTLRNVPKLPADAKIIFAINHLSNADPWCCVQPIFPRDAKWVCKGSLMKVPFGGWCLENNGDLKIEFTAEKGGWGTKKGSVTAMMEQARGYLNRKQPIAVFPEGVRNHNPKGPLNEFKLGFFMLAVETGATIVPIALSGSETCWPRGTWMFDRATVYLSCGEPISAAGHTAESLRDATAAAIEVLRNTHPDRIAMNKTA